MEENVRKNRNQDHMSQQSVIPETYCGNYFEHPDYYYPTNISYNPNNFGYRDSIFDPMNNEYPYDHHLYGPNEYCNASNPYQESYTHYEEPTAPPPPMCYDFNGGQIDRNTYNSYHPMIQNHIYRHDMPQQNYYTDVYNNAYNMPSQYNPNSYTPNTPDMTQNRIRNTYAINNNSIMRTPYVSPSRYQLRGDKSDIHRSMNYKKKVRSPASSNFAQAHIYNNSGYEDRSYLEHSTSDTLLTTPISKSHFIHHTPSIRLVNSRGHNEEMNMNKVEFPELSDSISEYGGVRTKSPTNRKMCNEDKKGNYTTTLLTNINNVQSSLKESSRKVSSEKNIDFDEYFSKQPTIPCLSYNNTSSSCSLTQNLPKVISYNLNKSAGEEFYTKNNYYKYVYDAEHDSSYTKETEIDCAVDCEYLIYPHIKDKDFKIQCDNFHEDLLFFLYYFEDDSNVRLSVISNLYKMKWRFNIKLKAWLKVAIYKYGDIYVRFDPIRWEYMHTNEYFNTDDIEDESYESYLNFPVTVATSQNILSYHKFKISSSPQPHTDDSKSDIIIQDET